MFRKLLGIAGATAAAGALVLGAAAPAFADTTDAYVQKTDLGIPTTDGSCSVFVVQVAGYDYASMLYNNAHSGVTCYVQLEKSANRGKSWSRVSGYDAVGYRANDIVLGKTYNYFVGSDEVRGCLTVRTSTLCTSVVTMSGDSHAPAQEDVAPVVLEQKSIYSTSKGSCQAAIVSGTGAKNSHSTAEGAFINATSGHTCSGWLERTTNKGKTWRTVSATHPVGSQSADDTYEFTSAYADGTGSQVRACFRVSGSSATHCSAAW